MLIPLVTDYRVELEQVASEQLGRAVSIGAINAEWIGLWPKIHLTDVSIQSKQEQDDWMKVSDVWLSLDFLSLLSKGSLDAERVKINGLNLDIVRKNEKEYLFNGEVFHLDQNNPDDQTNLLSWFFSRDRLQLVDCRFSYQDERYSTRKINLANANFYLENSGDLHHAYGRFDVADEQTSQLSFVLDLKGDMLRPQDVVSQFYIQGDVIVSTVMQEWMKSYVDLKKGALNLKLWGSGYVHRLQDIKAEIQAKDLLWSFPDAGLKKASSTVEELKASVFWQRRKDGWNLDVEKFRLSKNDFTWPESDIHMAYQDNESTGQVSLEGTIGYFKLQDVSGLLSGNLPDTLALSKEIKALDMHGSLRDVQFRYQQTGQQVPDVFLSSTFNDLGFKRWNNLPGVEGVDGRLVFTREKGFLQLDSQHAVLDLGDLFIKPLQVNTLQGDIFWHAGDDGLKLSFDSLAASNEHIQTLSRANIIIPKDQGSPFIDMAVNFQNGKVKSAPLYLPRGVMSKAVIQWLEKSFVDGHVPAGKMIFHGSTKDFPFINNHGTFLVDFDVEDMHLDYGDLWPQLSHVNANVLFHDNSLLVKIHEGEVMKVRLQPSVLIIDDLKDYSVLDMELEFEGKTQQLLSYLHNSPVSDEARELLANIKTDGSMSSHVKMAIPMERPAKFTLQGKTHFNKGHVVLKKWKHEFEKFSGDLNYKYDGRVFSYHADNLQAQYQGRPARIDVNTDIFDKYDAATTITLSSRLGLSQLFEDFLPANQKFFKGDSDWLLALSLHKKNKQLLLRSDLQGEEIILPDGFSKPAEQSRSLNIKSSLDSGSHNVISVSYGDLLSAVLQLNKADKQAQKWRFEKGTVNLGKAKKLNLPTEKGLDIQGELDSFSIEKWFDLLPDKKEKSTGLDPLRMINQVKLDINRLLLGQLQYNDFSLLATRRQSDLLLSLGAQEFSGQAIVPFEYEKGLPVSINLKHLSITTPGEKREASIFDPRTLPAVDLVSDKLLLNGHHLGQFILQARKDKLGLKIDKLQIKGDLLNISASGSWLFKKSWHVSSFDIDFETPKIGEALKLFDFQTNIEDGKASARLKASWSGPPHWFEMKRLNGDMKLSISKGQLHDVEPGGGRIFGLLSVQNLQRRLTLDFSDLFKKGFGFDKIEGDFSIADGDAYTNNLFMDGPAARIDISGRIGLANEDYDEDVYVTPKLSSSIPVLGLAAGPQVAIGLYLTERILRKNINKMSRTHYSVTGSWEKPVIHKNSDNKDVNNETVDP